VLPKFSALGLGLLTMENIAAKALTAFVPETPGEPIELVDANDALRVAFVHREFLGRLADRWETTGVYLLLDPISDDGTWGVYVGKATNLRTRVKQHIKEKPSWNRAVLVISDRTESFHSAQAGWLEGRVHHLLSLSALARPSNKQVPGDDTVPAHEQAMLWNCAVGTQRALRLLGYETAVEDELIGAGKGRKSKPAPVTGSLADLLDEGLLKPFETLTSLNGQWPAIAVLTADGLVDYGGTTYPTPSSAAKAVRNGGATNGWTFWGVNRGSLVVPLAMLRAEYSAKNA
jgi:Restriction Enzyme Adenine Methylase Associated